MNAVESWIFNYVVNSAWQTLILFGAAWVGARGMRRVMGAGAEHRVWVGALLLAVVVPALGLPRWGVWGTWWGGPGAEVVSGPGVWSAMGAASGVGTFGVSRAAGEWVVLVYLAVLLVYGVRLAWGLHRGWVLRRDGVPVRLGAEEAGSWARCCERFGVRDARLANSGEVAGPVTVGVWRRALLVPVGFLEEVDGGEREAALAHEFAHMSRRDWGKNLVYELVSLPLAFHPVMRAVKARLAESREMVCDELAAEAVGARREYARTLLRLASRIADRAPARTIHVIGIFDANILERRVMSLMTKRLETKRMVRVAVGAGCVVLGVAACGSAMALRMEVKAGGEKASDSQSNQKAKIVQPEVIYKENPVYPAEARTNKNTVNGPVVVAMTIGTDGLPRDLHVTKSLRADYDESALAAVRSWRFTPATRNGTPVEIQMSVGIDFQIYP